MNDVLPALQSGTVDETEWFGELKAVLSEYGVLVDVPFAAGPSAASHEPTVSFLRDSEVSRAVRASVSKSIVVPPGDHADVVFCDLSGFDRDAAIASVRRLYADGVAHLPVWTAGTEVLIGPLTVPGHHGCWACCHSRLSDSLGGGHRPLTSRDAGAIQIAADNLTLLTRFPDVAGLGWVVVDNGTVADPHAVVPMPHCEVCGGANRQVSPLIPLTQSPLVPAELRQLAGTRTGIIRRLYIFDTGSDGPQLPIACSASIAPTPSPGTPASFTGEGKGASRDEAIRSAIGEGIERYSASIWDPTLLTRASLTDWGDRAFDPRWLALYNDAQYQRPGFAYTPFDPDRVMSWVRGAWLDTAEPVYIPALAAFMNFPVDRSERFAQMSSNGLAAGTTLEHATLNALYELIERDAFMLHWLTQAPGARIECTELDPVTEAAFSQARNLGANPELYLLDVGTEHPTVVCLGLGDGRSWPGVTIGLGTHADIDRAIRRAVLEHSHCGTYIRRLMIDGQAKELRSPTDVLTGLDHALYFVPAERQSSLDGLRAAKDTPHAIISLRRRYRHAASVADCVDALAKAGIRTAAVDLTSSDVALAPLKVVRALGTNLQPVHFGYGNERWANPRLALTPTTSTTVEPHPLA
ncbi:MAG: YcaO-like family protein [Jatrophihabitans sp.]